MTLVSLKETKKQNGVFMLRIIGLIVVVGVVYLFLNWDDYRDDVNTAVDTIDEVAEQTEAVREDLNDKVEQLKEKIDD